MIFRGCKQFYHSAETTVFVVFSQLMNLGFSFFCNQVWCLTPVLLPGKSHGRRSLEGCSPWGCWRSDTTERLHFHSWTLSCIGEGNGNPLQYSCLENPRDRGAWWAAVYGVAQSWTRLKWLSSSSSSSMMLHWIYSYVHLCVCLL